MKQKQISFFLIALSLIFILTMINGCKKDACINCPLVATTGCLGPDTNSCICISYAPIDKVDAPNTASVEDNISFAVYWNFVTTCNTFSHFEQSQVGNTITVKTYMSNNSCEACGDVAGSTLNTFLFKPTGTGTYTFNFYNPYPGSASNNGFITKTVGIY